jgi:hypothetical protein
VHLVLRKTEVACANVFHGVEFDFLEADDLGFDMDLAVGDGTFRQVFLVEDIEDFDLGVIDGIGEIIDICFLDVGFFVISRTFSDYEICFERNYG